MWPSLVDQATGAPGHGVPGGAPRAAGQDVPFGAPLTATHNSHESARDAGHGGASFAPTQGPPHGYGAAVATPTREPPRASRQHSRRDAPLPAAHHPSRRPTAPRTGRRS